MTDMFGLLTTLADLSRIIQFPIKRLKRFTGAFKVISSLIHSKGCHGKDGVTVCVCVYAYSSSARVMKCR